MGTPHIMPVTRRIKHALQNAVMAAPVAVIRIYQVAFSSITPGTCRFSPTCSCYATDALRNHGLFRGGFLALKRIVRCHPWGNWGYDPVPQPGQTEQTEQ